jgi:hypothetical protein
MGSSPEYALLGDIGATNARLALLSKGLLGPIERFTVARAATRAGNAVLKTHQRGVRGEPNPDLPCESALRKCQA